MNKKENMIKFYKFALVGLSNTLVSYLVFLLTFKVFGWVNLCRSTKIGRNKFLQSVKSNQYHAAFHGNRRAWSLFLKKFGKLQILIREVLILFKNNLFCLNMH